MRGLLQFSSVPSGDIQSDESLAGTRNARDEADDLATIFHRLIHKIVNAK